MTSATEQGHKGTVWGRRFDVHWPDMLAMLARNRDVALKTWRVNVLPPLLEPVLYLMAFGFGLGALVQEVNGMDYIVFIAPALITITMMQTAFFETTYSSFVRMYFQKTWDAVVATPLTVEDVIVAELLWAATKSAIYSTLMSIVVAMFGLLTFPGALWIPLIAFFVGLMFASMGMIITSKVPTIDTFSYAFYLFITPQFLFAGTFFPVEQLPNVVEHLALALPLTAAVQLTRGVVLAQPTGLEMYGAVYLVVASGVLSWVAVQMMKKRLVQ